MNWKDVETDAWPKQGRAALTLEDRATSYALVQQKVTREHLYARAQHQHARCPTRARGACARMIYQNTFYKGLDTSF